MTQLNDKQMKKEFEASFCLDNPDKKNNNYTHSMYQDMYNGWVGATRHCEEEIAGWAKLVNSWKTDAKRYESALKTVRKLANLENDKSIVDFITNVLEGTTHEL